MSKNGKKTPKSEYEVGHGRPPEHSQFKKGQSGNPKGRPRRSKDDFGEVVRRQGSRMIQVQENGQHVKMPAKEVLFTQTLRAALAGDPRARKEVIALLDRYDVKPPTPYEESPEVVAEKKRLAGEIVQALERFRSEKKGERPSWRPPGWVDPNAEGEDKE